MSKFKVGDKVRVRKWADMEKEFGAIAHGTIINIGPQFVEGMKEYCSKVITISGINSCGYYTIAGDIWKFCDEMLEPVKKDINAIVIYEKDNKVIALDKSTGKTAEAICSPEDKFDFYTGADLAFERLLGRKPAPKTREETPKYFTGEMVCIKSADSWYTKGKIYKVKNGVWVDDDGDAHETSYKSVEKINACVTSQFVEVVK